MGVLPTQIHQYTQDTRLLCSHLSGLSITVIILTFWQARLSASPVSRSSKHRFPQAPALVKMSLVSAVLNLTVDVHTGPHKLIQCAQLVRNPPVSARDLGSIPGSRRPLEKEAATRSSILAWNIPWTEESGGYIPWRGQSWTQLGN